MKITEYPLVVSTDVAPEYVSLLDGANGTKSIPVSELRYALFEDVPHMHRCIYRGMNLGSTITAEQHAEISAGTFRGLWLGDYWTDSSGRRWRIADFDYFDVNQHSEVNGAYNGHTIQLVCDTIYGQSRFHSSTDMKSVGYQTSEIRSTVVAAAYNQLSSDFGTLAKKEVINSTAIADNGSISSVIRTAGALELLSSRMVLGELLYGDVNDSAGGSGVRTSTQHHQLALFNFASAFIANGQPYWLSDLANSSKAVFLSERGRLDVISVVSPQLGARLWCNIP